MARLRARSAPRRPGGACDAHSPVAFAGPRRRLAIVVGRAAQARRFAQETGLGLTRRARRINRELAELYPDAHTELDFTTPLELAVATILSAQCTDKRVNEVTPGLSSGTRRHR